MGGQKIVLNPNEVWDYFQKNKEKLESSMHEIASNEEFGITIYVTEESGMPRIIVCEDDNEIYGENTVSSEDCRHTVNEFYEDYLTERVVDFLSSDQDEEEEDLNRLEIDDMIDTREMELDEAIYQFICVACDCDNYNNFYYDDEMVDDLKEHFLEYLYRKWDVDIRRPMYLEDSEGEFFKEYPYPYMVFDDEDNPIYKMED